MNYIEVTLWGEELGRLAWDPVKRTSYFMFNPAMKSRPDVSPLLRPAEKDDSSLPVYGEAGRIYQDLPPFIADSLPDSWGNRLFDQWVRQRRISRSKITPLDKLTFIGQRGMGALEFHPAVKELEHSRDIDMESLYQLSLDILNQRENISLDTLEDLTFRALLSVGTSAGGRQMKAILAIDRSTGVIRSGQIASLENHDYYIVKFQDELVPTSEIEMAFYEMAIKAGITMEECRLLRVEGVSHFMTRRFDRKDGAKIHMQTLAAINPDAGAYEDLMDTCRGLRLSEGELQEVYRRLVFNVLANNTDDHNKNFSFLLPRRGKWQLAPAYDMTFIFAHDVHHPQPERCMSLYGKVSDITKQDLLDFAKDNSIRNAEQIIANVAEALMDFTQLSDKYHIPSRWSDIIEKTLHTNLIKFGYRSAEPVTSEFTDPDGRKFHITALTTDTRGYYRLDVTIDGKSGRRFIKPGTTHHRLLYRHELGDLSIADLSALLCDLLSDWPPLMRIDTNTSRGGCK